MPTAVQQLVDELQDMKRRKSQLMFELSALEREEFGIVQRLQIELGISSTDVSSDEASKRAAAAANGEATSDGAMKRARVEYQGTTPSVMLPHIMTTYPSFNAMQSLPTPLPPQPTRPQNNSTAAYVGPPPTSLPLTPITLPVAPTPTPLPWGGKSAPMAVGSLPSALPRPTSRSTHPPPSSDPDPQQAAHRERQLQLAVRLRGALGDVDARSINMKLLLKTGVLAGEAVDYRKQSGAIINTGVLTQQGCVMCACAVCKVACPPAEISCSLFEEHSGSSMKRPADFIWLQHYNCTIKELITLVQGVDLEHCCRICGHGGEQGELLCCDVCASSFHGSCLGIHPTCGRGPECPACKAKANGTPFNMTVANTAAGLGPTPTPSPSDYPSATSPATATPTPAHSPSPPDAASPHLKTEQDPTSSHTSPPSHPPTSSAPPPPTSIPPAAAAAAAAAAAVAAANAAHREQVALGRRLFQGGALRHGERVRYVAGPHERQLQGLVHSTPSLSGILCSCCSKVVSPAEFEQHAGHSQRQASFDRIRTDSGLSLRQLAERQPSESLLADLSPASMDNGMTPDNQQGLSDQQDLQQLLWQQQPPPMSHAPPATMPPPGHMGPVSTPMAGAEVYVSG